MNVRSSLRTRILLLTGTIISLLMLVISFILLFKWREMIIENQTENAVAVSRTFAVTVIDAMIYEDKSVYRKENILETYVENFRDRMGTVTYVLIADAGGAPLVQVAGGTGREPFTPPAAMPDDGSRRTVRIYENDALGWTLEVREPLLFSGRRWGTAVIGFDASRIRTEVSDAFFLLLTATIVITAAVLYLLTVLINRMTSSIESLVTAIDALDFTADRNGTDAPKDEIGLFRFHFTLLQERLAVSKQELQRAQQQVYQAEKLASIGRLASGVAHQVNNPLNGIKSCLYAIRQNPQDRVKVAEYLGYINEGLDDIETVVKKLLGFARQQPASESLIDINEAVRKVTGLFELRLKEKQIAVTQRLDEGLGRVRIDYHLFQEVVMNLVLNSFDAIDRNGSIDIVTRADGPGHAVLEVRDTGAGIAPDNLRRIFDPFFTTKDVGTGTGLGLSVCLGIVESHGGRIDVQSTPGAGTLFTVTLPVSPEPNA